MISIKNYESLTIILFYLSEMNLSFFDTSIAIFKRKRSGMSIEKG